MKSDVIVIGAELDGQVAAMRLLELGHTVRIFARGAGSLHYAPGGIHVLGYSPEGNGDTLPVPMAGMPALDDKHPYRLLGEDRTRLALEWFFGAGAEMHRSFAANGRNVQTLTPAGLKLPTYAPLHHQASVDALTGAKVAVVSFAGHQDFPTGLIINELVKLGICAASIDLEPPEGRTGNVALAQAFDRHANLPHFFRTLTGRVAPQADIILFPAVLGLERHEEIVEAARAEGVTCMEVPTLPPSVPGLRLSRALHERLVRGQALIHEGTRVTGAVNGDGRVASIRDERDGSFEAAAFVLSSGGILMGGLDVDSFGTVHEPTFGLDVVQTAPLDADRVDRTLDALHRAGIDTDGELRPKHTGSGTRENLFVTGGTLAHWNPMAEASAEGVPIATGWAAAEAVHTYLGGGR